MMRPDWLAQAGERARAQLNETANVLKAVSEQLAQGIAEAAAMWLETLRDGGLIAFCGNGGSAADAQHLAGELVGRFRKNRAPYRALALTTDTSVLTAIGNDFGFEEVFARQVAGLLRAGDLLVALSTSGQARNCLRAAQQARQLGVRTMAFTGASGGELKHVVELCLCVPSEVTPRIQEAHIAIGHILCDLVEAALSGDA